MDLVRASVAPPKLGYLGAYRLEEEIGRGGQGVVFRAVQPGTDREVAIKRLAGGRFASAAARSQLRREIQISAGLTHPGIVAVHAAEVLDGQLAIVMELVDGRPIDRWASGREPGWLTSSLRLFAQVCAAVAHAHRRGVIHRDLKPSNILVDASGRARVLDFGLADLVQRSGGAVDIPGENPGRMEGTPGYAAPEQRRGAAADTRSDVHALGVVLWVMLTGRQPPEEGRLGRVCELVRLGASGREIDALISKATAADPDQRYAGADALLEDVERLLGHRPLEAMPSSAGYRLRTMARRHPVSCAALACSGVLIMGLAGLSTAQALRLSASAAELRESAEAARRSARRSDLAAEMLREMFRTFSEGVAAGERSPAERMVSETSARLAEQGREQPPEHRIVLWRTLAEMSLVLREMRGFETAVAEATRISRQELPDDAVEAARCLLLMGLVSEYRADYATAMERYGVAAAELERLSGEQDPDLSRALNNLGSVKTNMGDTAGALVTLDRALKLRVDHFGEQSRQASSTMRNIGAAHRRAKRFDEAEKWLERSLAAAQAAPDGGWTAVSVRSQMARLARDQQEYDRAVALFRGELASIEQLAGPDSPRATRTYQFLANTLRRMGRYADALEALDRAIALAEGLPRDHPMRTDLMIDRGENLFSMERFSEAERMFERAAELADGASPRMPERAAAARSRAAAARAGATDR